ncbi:MAG: multiheme c-type cytochrome [Planctomycetota bacterium]|jgi:hypothetical protein
MSRIDRRRRDALRGANGTQPDPTGLQLAPFETANSCATCHGNYYDPVADDEPYDAWAASMMAQSARDPVWQAALAVANQDANLAGEACIRCHAPTAWLAGKSGNGTLDDFSAIDGDFDGVSCSFCHRSVSPTLEPESPAEDEAILEALQLDGLDFSQPGQGRFVVDPHDVRRGPFADVPLNLHGVPIIVSPYHRRSELCAPCHDVSIPTYSKQPDGTYALNALGAPHPTGDPHEMFPEQRTYSEWLHSDFAKGGVVFPDGRFGGNLTAVLPNTVGVSSCQDCHMPDVDAGGCAFWSTPPFFPRPDMPRHAFLGSNTWVLGAVLDLYGPYESGLTEESVEAARQATIGFLQAASDIELSQVDDDLNVRLINQTGHKLPTGYPEGRRMWINVRFLDGSGEVVAEHGHYDHEAAELDEDSTTVYRALHGIDETIAEATGLESGPASHLALNNVIYFDNRIPPRGFTNAAYESVGAAPVGVTYPDGQHWDDSSYAIPGCATTAEVTVYHQTTSREYIEFLRDAITDPGNDAGQVAYDQWVAQGKSAPVAMDTAIIELAPPGSPDVDGDGTVTVDDLIDVILAWGPCSDPPVPCPADTDCNGTVDVDDLINVILHWG